MDEPREAPQGSDESPVDEAWRREHFRQQEAALVSGRGAAPIGGWTEIDLTGKDRAKFLHSFCTNDIKRLSPGEGCEAFVLNPKGNILGHVLVFAGEEKLTLSTVPEQAGRLLAHLERYILREDVQLHDRSAESAVRLLAGEGWELILPEIMGTALPQAMYGVSSGTWGGIPVEVRRVPIMHPHAWMIVSRSDESSLVETGRQLRTLLDGGFYVDRHTFEVARIAAGYPWFGEDGAWMSDITTKNLPQEVARDSVAISFKKGCYLGQETVARIDALGHVNKLLCGLRFRDDVLVPDGDLRDGSAVVGAITSAARSNLRDCYIGLGYVRREHTTPGTKLACNAGEVEIVRLPME